MLVYAALVYGHHQHQHHYDVVVVVGFYRCHLMIITMIVVKASSDRLFYYYPCECMSVREFPQDFLRYFSYNTSSANMLVTVKQKHYKITHKIIQVIENSSSHTRLGQSVSQPAYDTILFYVWHNLSIYHMTSISMAEKQHPTTHISNKHTHKYNNNCKRTQKTFEWSCTVGGVANWANT